VSNAAPAGDPFEALGDPNRRAIVELLGGGGRSVGEVAEALPISRPAVSRHLRLLKEAGLVVEEPQGTRRIYRLHDQGVAAVEAYLTQVWGEAVGRFRLLAENTTPSPERAPAGAPPGARIARDRSAAAQLRARMRPLGYLWHIGRERAQATDVELTFVDLGDGRTRLDIVHSGRERLGDEGVAWQEANTRGWSALIPSYVAAAEA
jgi:DNA-binding transcriptional ArsR family regulator